MRIWIDITNAPHVTFFRPFIELWSKQGHEVVVTARDYSNTLSLLERENIQARVVGKHYGKNIILKIFGLFHRSALLTGYVLKMKPDVAISQSSFYSPIVAKLTKTKCLYTNDNEYAKGNIVGDKLATYVLYPQALKKEKGKLKNALFYPGVKESIYLDLANLQQLVKSKPSTGQQHKVKILFRPEPWSAQYHNNDLKVFQHFIERLAKCFNVTVTPRDDEQRLFFSKIDNLDILPKPLSLDEIVTSFDLFIGAGGSMSRELALIGFPTISVYRGELLSVDKKLINEGILVHSTELSVEKVSELYEQLKKRSPVVDYIEHGRLARQLFSELLLSE